MGAVVMTNRYSGTCYRCGLRVKPEAGIVTFENFPGTRWPELNGTRNMTLIEHPHCRSAYDGTDVHYFYKPDETDDCEVIESE